MIIDFPRSILSDILFLSDDWAKFTDYRGYEVNDEVVQWFWKCVRSWPPERKSRLLQFATGTSRIPVNGFKDLQGSDGPRRFTIEKSGDPSQLPKSHTCFNRIDLPPYKDYATLEQKLTLAVEWVSSRVCSEPGDVLTVNIGKLLALVRSRRIDGVFSCSTAHTNCSYPRWITMLRGYMTRLCFCSILSNLSHPCYNSIALLSCISYRKSLSHTMFSAIFYRLSLLRVLPYESLILMYKCRISVNFLRRAQMCFA